MNTLKQRNHRNITHKTLGWRVMHGFLVGIFILGLSIFGNNSIYAEVASSDTSSENILIVLDCSESMGEPYQNQTTRLEYAKSQIIQLVHRYNTYNWALMTFGSTINANRCEDVMLRIPFPISNNNSNNRTNGRTNATQFIQELNRCQPGSKTPLALALFQAHQYNLSLDTQAKIVLFSDGYDNCSGNPSHVLRLYKDDQMDLSIIAIDPGDDSSNLANLAQPPLITYYQANEPVTFDTVITQAIPRPIQEPISQTNSPPSHEPDNRPRPPIVPQIRRSFSNLRSGTPVRTGPVIFSEQTDIEITPEPSENSPPSETRRIRVPVIREPVVPHPTSQEPQEPTHQPNLSIPPYPLTDQMEPPDYPSIARRYGMEGIVKLRLEINEAGHVESLDILNSSGYPVLDSAAIEALRFWGFSPAQHNGIPVPYSLIKTVIFRLSEEL